MPLSVARLLGRRAHVEEAPVEEAPIEVARPHVGGERRVTPRRLQLPARGDTVTLIIASGDPVPARVLQQGTRELLLVTILPIPLLSVEQCEAIVLEFAASAGRVRLGGSFEQQEPGAPEVLLMSEPRVIEVLQQRAFGRVNVTRQIFLYTHEGAAPIGAHTVDVGGGGCLLDGAEELTLNEMVDFELWLTRDDPPVRGVARVVRVDSAVAGRRGLAFESLDDRERARILHVVASYVHAEQSSAA